MKDYYRYRFIRPGLAPDKGLARVIGWVLGAGILIAIWSIGIEGKGIRGEAHSDRTGNPLIRRILVRWRRRGRRARRAMQE
jgi:hypothetical protein